MKLANFKQTRTIPLALTRFNEVEQEGLPIDFKVFQQAVDPDENLTWLDTKYHIASPEYYPGCRLIWVNSEHWPSDRLLFLSRSNEPVRMTGSSYPIHFVNVNNLSLPALGEEGSESTILGYLEFFCFAVRANMGAFHIVTERDLHPSIVYQKDANPRSLDLVRVLKDYYRPPRVWGREENGDFRASALVWHFSAVYYADFIIQSGGMIEMVDDFPLEEVETEAGHPALQDSNATDPATDSNTPSIDATELRNRTAYNPYNVAQHLARTQKVQTELLKNVKMMDEQLTTDQDAEGSTSVTLNGLGELISVNIRHQSLTAKENDELSNELTALIHSATLERKKSAVKIETDLYKKHGMYVDDNMVQRFLSRFKKRIGNNGK